jgi:hypothetical protein
LSTAGAGKWKTRTTAFNSETPAVPDISALQDLKATLGAAFDPQSVSENDF